MKHPVVILFLLLICQACFASPAKSKEDFLAAVRAAYDAKDIKRVHDLTWVKGISESDREKMNQPSQNPLKFLTEVESISLQPQAGFRPPLQAVSFGKRREFVYPPAGMVKIRMKLSFPSASTYMTATMSLPYAIIDGAYYLVGVKTTDVGWKGPPDRPFGVALDGVGQDKVKFNLKFNASGVDLESDVPHEVIGQYITEATVTSVDDSVDVTLRIYDGKKSIYISRLKGKGEIDYKKGN